MSPSSVVRGCLFCLQCEQCRRCTFTALQWNICCKVAKDKCLHPAFEWVDVLSGCGKCFSLCNHSRLRQILFRRKLSDVSLCSGL